MWWWRSSSLDPPAAARAVSETRLTCSTAGGDATPPPTDAAAPPAAGEELPEARGAAASGLPVSAALPLPAVGSASDDGPSPPMYRGVAPAVMARPAFTPAAPDGPPAPDAPRPAGPCDGMRAGGETEEPIGPGPLALPAAAPLPPDAKPAAVLPADESGPPMTMPALVIGRRLTPRSGFVGEGMRCCCCTAAPPGALPGAPAVAAVTTPPAPGRCPPTAPRSVTKLSCTRSSLFPPPTLAS